MSGSIQSQNFVPGVSGWKLDRETGDFEMNSAKIQVGSLPSDPQLITITAGEWSDSELPVNAIEHYRFIGDQVMMIPVEHRGSAEFATKDISFDRDGSDIRTTLTYERRETAEEVKARQEKAKVAGTSIKFEKGAMTITHNGVARVRLGDLDASPSREAETPVPKPFIVVDGVTYIRQAFVDDGAINKTKIANDWTVKLEILNGMYVSAGFVFDPVPPFLVEADQFALKEPPEFEKAKAKGADALLEMLARQISEIEMGIDLDNTIAGKADSAAVQVLASRITSLEAALVSNAANLAQFQAQVDIANQVRQIIRNELRPGGLLHRSS